MPNTNPEVIDASSMDLVTSIAKSKARCDYGIYFGASSDNAKVGPQFVNQAVRAALSCPFQLSFISTHYLIIIVRLGV
jgi:dihydroorotase-like cyclic amidohydrolase